MVSPKKHGQSLEVERKEHRALARLNLRGVKVLEEWEEKEDVDATV